METETLEKLLALDASSLKTYMLLSVAQRLGGDHVRTYRLDIANLLGRSTRTVSTALSTLRRAGLITRIGKGRYVVATLPRK